MLFDATIRRAASIRSPYVLGIGGMLLNVGQKLLDIGLYLKALSAFDRSLAYLPLEHRHAAMKGRGLALQGMGKPFRAALAYSDEGALSFEAGKDCTGAYLRARDLFEELRSNQKENPYWLLQRGLILLSLAHVETMLENFAAARSYRSGALKTLARHLVQTGAVKRYEPNSCEAHRLKSELERVIGKKSPPEARAALERLWEKVENSSGNFLTATELLALDSPSLFAARQPADLLTGGLSLFQTAALAIPPPFAMPLVRMA